MFDDKDMEVARTTSPRVRPRDVLIVGAFVVGWSVGRAATDTPAAEVPAPVELRPVAAPAVELAPAPVVELRRPLWRKSVRLALAGMAAALVLAAAGLAARPDDARAPLVAPDVAAREHALAVKQAEAARVKLLRHLELAGIAARRVAGPETPKAKPKPLAVFVQPSDRAAALATYIDALGTETILRGLDASKDQLEQQVLNDPRVHIYPGGGGDISSGRVDVRILAMIEYLAQANGEVSVSCLITGHSYFVHGRPGVVSAHVYGRAVDVSAVGNVPILDHQGTGSVTEKAIRQILALPESVEPLQVISLMTLGGPSFALADHYNHIHIGY
jgi:hypothetical protein